MGSKNRTSEETLFIARVDYAHQGIKSARKNCVNESSAANMLLTYRMLLIKTAYVTKVLFYEYHDLVEDAGLYWFKNREYEIMFELTHSTRQVALITIAYVAKMLLSMNIADKIQAT